MDLGEQGEKGIYFQSKTGSKGQTVMGTGHVRTVSSPNHTFSWSSLTKQLAST